MTGQALVLGAEPRVAVTIARSLHRRDIRVSVAALSLDDRPITSRAIHSFLHLPDCHNAPQNFLDVMCQLIRRQRFDMLIPITDTALAVVAEHYEYLRELLHVGCPPPHVVKRVLDKEFTLAVAKRCGIPIPTAYLISDAADLEALGSGLHFPMIAKPRTKTDIASHGFKIRYFQTLRGLAEAFRTDPQFRSHNLLQEYCVGEGVGIGSLVHKGQPVALFQHRRLKEFPARGGVSVLAISESLNPLLVEYATTLLRALEWEGIAMVEFRYNRNGGQAALMEVNGRYWGSLSSAVHAGLDFPFYEWQLAHGQRPQVPSSYPVGVRVRWTTGHLLRLHGLFTDPIPDGLPASSKLKELAEFVIDFRPGIRSALWSIADPLPAVSEFIQALKGLLLADAKAIIRRLVPKSVFNVIRIYRTLGQQSGSVYLKLQALRALGLRRDHDRRLPDDVRSILFVCHGNIIRSPMAAAMLTQALQNSERKITILSAGLHITPGAGADERARIVAKDFGISLHGHKVQPLTAPLVHQSDVIFVMDYLNEARLIARYPEARQKVFMLGTCSGNERPDICEISDPYHGDMADIHRCYESLRSCIHILAGMLLSSSSQDPKPRLCLDSIGVD